MAYCIVVNLRSSSKLSLNIEATFDYYVTHNPSYQRKPRTQSASPPIEHRTNTSQCTVASTSLIIHSPDSTLLERYLFSTTSFPRIPPSDHLTPFAPAPESATTTTPPDIAAPPPTTTAPTDPTKEKRFHPPPASNLPEQFRATLARLSTLHNDLAPLPRDCSFTVAIELRDEQGVEAPIGNPQPWVAAEPGLQREREGGGDGERGKSGKDVGGVKTTPVRSLEAGAFVMEVWVEEGRGKFEGEKGLGSGGREERL